MKNNLVGILVGVLLLLTTVSAQAYSLAFQNWGFDPTGLNTGSIISPIDEMTLLGLTLNNSVPNSTTDPLGHGTFRTLSTLQVENFQNDNIIIGGTGVNNSYQITLVMESTGTYNRNLTGLNELIFLTGSLRMYLDTTLNYGATTGLFGADDGTPIATFTLLNGTGLMDYRIANPDGRTDLHFGATQLATGYWFDSYGHDMSISPYSPLIIGLTDSNNQVIRNASTVAKSELTSTGLVWTPEGDAANYTTFLSTNGSFAPAPSPVPEPTSMVLLGCGLIGVAGWSRKLSKK